MATNVVLQHLDHEAIHSAAGGGDELQHVAAGALGVQRALDRLDLPAHPANPFRQLVFAANGVGHLPQYTPAGYITEAAGGVLLLRKTIASLCLMLTVLSAMAVVTHHHSNSSESLTCPVCVAARASAVTTTASSPRPVFHFLSAVRREPILTKYRLSVFALSVRPPPAT